LAHVEYAYQKSLLSALKPVQNSEIVDAQLLLSVDSEEKREFYIAETVKNNWSSRQLERQVYSNLYERLLLSNDKESVLVVAKNEKLPFDAIDIIKDPIYLEFLGLKKETSFYEKDLEALIIMHLQNFLLELGNVKRKIFCHVPGCQSVL
jgi:predicted nuclease of restriction endonuclease-like (RecB) superfamily